MNFRLSIKCYAKNVYIKSVFYERAQKVFNTYGKKTYQITHNFYSPETGSKATMN